MHESFAMMAVDPAGPFAAVFGITWTLLFPTSGVAAFVSAVLCPFQRTVRQALRLGKVGLWTGSIAFIAMIVAILATAGFPTDPPESAVDALIDILLTGIAPTVAFFTVRFSRRRIAMLETLESAKKSLQTTGATPVRPAKF